MGEPEEDRTLIWRRPSSAAYGVRHQPDTGDRMREPVHPESYVNVNQPAASYAYPPAPTATQLAVWRAQRIIYYVFGIIQAFIAIRFILKLLSANTASPFTQVIYNVSWVFVFPFNGVVPNYTVGSTVFEWSSLIALVVYALVSVALAKLLSLLL